MTAVGIVVGLWLAQRRARELDLDASRLTRAALVMTVAGIIGAISPALVAAGALDRWPCA